MIIDKEESIKLIQSIKDKNFEIRNLNDFIDESASELQVSDINNLEYVYSFYIKIINNKKITSDKELIEIFNEEYIKDKNIAVHMQDYLKTYGEIKEMYDSIENNKESTIELVENLLKSSSLELFKNKESNSFIYTINKKNINELEELRNKILMTNANKAKQEKEKNGKEKKDKDKAQITKEYIIHRDDNAVTLGKLDGKELYNIEYALYDTEKLPVKIVNHEFNYSINLEYIKK